MSEYIKSLCHEYLDAIRLMERARSAGDARRYDAERLVIHDQLLQQLGETRFFDMVSYAKKITRRRE